MGAAVSINRLDLTASELRKAASGEKNSAAARRTLALALVLDGLDRKTAVAESTHCHRRQPYHFEGCDRRLGAIQSHPSGQQRRTCQVRSQIVQPLCNCARHGVPFYVLSRM